MKVLIACEYSGIVRDAFAAKGHDAWSCDLLPTERPGNHYEGYLEDFIGSGREWDLIIAHPPCTYLSAAGLHWNNKIPGRKEKTLYSMAFVKMIWNRECPHIAIENPVGYLNTHWKKPTQTIEPFYFGESERKRTCLWLKGLPRLNGLVEVAENKKDHEPQPMYVDKKTGKKRYFTDSISGGSKGQKERSKIFQGIANAMADQWGSIQKLKVA